MKYTYFLVVFIISSFIVFSCKRKYNDVSNISSAGDDESHNFGQNCMQCHKTGGKGEGWFTIAGSVNNGGTGTPANSGTIKFYTGPNQTGSLVYTVAIDALGNFFTTDDIDPNGLYPVAVNSLGETNAMSSSVSTGSCNTCHGNSVSPIYN